MKQAIPNPRVAILKRAFMVLALASCAAALTVPSLAGRGGGGDHGGGRRCTTRIIPPNVEAYGTSYSELAGAWWNWALNQPPDKNPILDQTGEFAAMGQDENWGQGRRIFFLAGNFGGETVRECTVPKGKALFFPLANNVFVTPEEGTVEEVRPLANAATDPTSLLECSIDGVPIGDLFAYRAQSPPGGSPLEVRPGSFAATLIPPRGAEPAVSDGYWLLVELGEGKEHTIEFRAKVGDLDSPDFELSVKYLLTVEDNHHGHGGH